MFAGTGDIAHVEADFLPAPDQQATGKGDVGPVHADIINDPRQRDERPDQDRRRPQHAPLEAALRQPVQKEDCPGAEPP